MAQFDTLFILLAVSGAMLSFFLIGVDHSRHVGAIPDPSIANELAKDSDHFILFIVHTMLRTIGLNHVKFFQWRVLMTMKSTYLTSLIIHSVTALCWMGLSFLIAKESSNTEKKPTFSRIGFLTNCIFIALSMLMLYTLSLVYLPIIKNGLTLNINTL